MIFTSLGLLLVSLGLLVAGIAKSSVTLLMASLACTVVSGIVLATVLPATRRLAAAGAGGVGAVGTNGAQPMVLYVQQAPAPATAATSMPATQPMPALDVREGNGDAPPIVGYDDMTAQQITKLIASGALTDDQLDALREYERAHAGRKSVLAKLS